MTDEPITGDRDPFYKLAYDESLRGLSQQAAVVDGVRGRAGLIITAANVVTALLATAAIRDRPGIGYGGWAAIGAFVLVMVLCLFILAPQRGWSFTFDAKRLIGMIEGPNYPTLGSLHRRLAELNEDSQTSNQQKVSGYFRAIRWASGFLAAEVVLWILVLAKVTAGGVPL